MYDEIIEHKSSIELTDEDLRKVNCLKCKQMLELLKLFKLVMGDSNIEGSLICKKCGNSIIIEEDFDKGFMEIEYIKGTIYD